MPQWLQHPATWIIAGVAVLTAIITIARWTGSVDADRRNFKSFMDEIRNDIKQIFKRLPDPAVVSSASPLQLTDLGESMSEFMKAKNWAGEIAPQLLPQVINKQPFEVDQVAQDYVKGKLGEEMDRQVAACAYEYGRTQDRVLDVLHVVLRDELLRLRDQQ